MLLGLASLGDARPHGDRHRRVRERDRLDTARRLEDGVHRVAETDALEAPHGLAVEPDGTRQLFANVSVGVRRGEHLLLTGNSGTGKSSMLRAVAGLWDRGEGAVWRPSAGEAVFLPDEIGWKASLLTVIGIMGLWYLVVVWNEVKQKLVVV